MVNRSLTIVIILLGCLGLRQIFFVHQSLDTSMIGVDVSTRWDILEELNYSQEYLEKRLHTMNVSAQSEVVTLWSTDFHISPVADVKGILEKVPDTRARIIDKSLSGACRSMGTCAKDLLHLNYDNGQVLGNCPAELRRKFYDEYTSTRNFIKNFKM